MIFVTVGTHEQQFNRLVEYMDNYAKKHQDEDVIIQTGYCTYEPQHAKYKKFFSHNEMKKCISEARIVITHGGPASFMSVLQSGKVPIVVPRQKRYGEHVNDHQLTFCREVEKKYGYIKVCDVKDIAKCIDLSSLDISEIQWNNDIFCQRFGIIVDELLSR